MAQWRSGTVLRENQIKIQTREHWIQRITFAAETNAAPQYLRSLIGGEGNQSLNNLPLTKINLQFVDRLGGP